MSSPLFSCVIPVKGDRTFISEALSSLEAQGIGDELEIIVQDGDIESGEVGEWGSGGVESDGVRWYREEDSGQSDALNRGFAKARGEWLFWLNADDILLSGALRKVQQLITHNSQLTTLNWIAGNTIYIDEKGRVTDVRTDAKWRPWFGRQMSVWTGGPSAFFRRELWQEHGGFDVDFKFVMDLELWTRWARMGIRFKSVDDYIWGFRVHEGSTTYKRENKGDMDLEFQKLLHRCNICHETFWRNITRMVSVFDGTRWRRVKDSYRLRGKCLFDSVGRRG